MLLTLLPTFAFAEAEAEAILTDGEIIALGSYPQTLVTDESLIAALTEKAGSTDDWTSYNYYQSKKQSDYMKYTDTEYDGEKYRAVFFTDYRPDYPTNSTGAGSSYQDNNGYASDTVYWFRYEPVLWRVLDADTGLLLSETILDSQAYRSEYYMEGGSIVAKYYTDSSKTCSANIYEVSGIRAWLNNDFLNTAFSAQTQEIIETVTVENDILTVTTPAVSNPTSDKIFLLSYSDMQNSAYGFSETANDCDTARSAKGSDYAKAQGLCVSTASTGLGSSNWFLRTSGTLTNGVCNVESTGAVKNSATFYRSCYGVRPAINIRVSALACPVSSTGKHIAVTDSAVTATCTKTGLTEGSHCSECNGIIVPQKKTGITEHSWDEGVVTKEADCTENGIITYTCTVCKAVKTETAKHTCTYVYYFEVHATATKQGYRLYKCFGCGKTKTYITKPDASNDCDSCSHSEGGLADWYSLYVPEKNLYGIYQTMYCRTCKGNLHTTFLMLEKIDGTRTCTEDGDFDKYIAHFDEVNYHMQTYCCGDGAAYAWTDDGFLFVGYLDEIDPEDVPDEAKGPLGHDYSVYEEYGENQHISKCSRCGEYDESSIADCTMVCTDRSYNPDRQARITTLTCPYCKRTTEDEEYPVPVPEADDAKYCTHYHDIYSCAEYDWYPAKKCDYYVQPEIRMDCSECGYSIGRVYPLLFASECLIDLPVAGITYSEYYVGRYPWNNTDSYCTWADEYCTPITFSCGSFDMSGLLESRYCEHNNVAGIKVSLDVPTTNESINNSYVYCEDCGYCTETINEEKLVNHQYSIKPAQEKCNSVNDVKFNLVCSECGIADDAEIKQNFCKAGDYTMLSPEMEPIYYTAETDFYEVKTNYHNYSETAYYKVTENADSTISLTKSTYEDIYHLKCFHLNMEIVLSEPVCDINNDNYSLRYQELCPDCGETICDLKMNLAEVTIHTDCTYFFGYSAFICAGNLFQYNGDLKQYFLVGEDNSGNIAAFRDSAGDYDNVFCEDTGYRYYATYVKFTDKENGIGEYSTKQIDFNEYHSLIFDEETNGISYEEWVESGCNITTNYESPCLHPLELVVSEGTFNSADEASYYLRCSNCGEVFTDLKQLEVTAEHILPGPCGKDTCIKEHYKITACYANCYTVYGYYYVTENEDGTITITEAPYNDLYCSHNNWDDSVLNIVHDTENGIYTFTMRDTCDKCGRITSEITYDMTPITISAPCLPGGTVEGYLNVEAVWGWNEETQQYDYITGNNTSPEPFRYFSTEESRFVLGSKIDGVLYATTAIESEDESSCTYITRPVTEAYFRTLMHGYYTLETYDEWIANGGGFEDPEFQTELLHSYEIKLSDGTYSASEEAYNGLVCTVCGTESDRGEWDWREDFVQAGSKKGDAYCTKDHYELTVTYTSYIKCCYFVTENEDGTVTVTKTSYEDVYAAPECEHSYTPVTVAPTCTEKGYTEYYCLLCGEKKTNNNGEAVKDKMVDANGHDLAEAVSDGNGRMNVYCKVCGELCDSYDAPATEEEPTGVAKVIKTIKNFFDRIAEFFKKLFGRG